MDYTLKFSMESTRSGESMNQRTGDAEWKVCIYVADIFNPKNGVTFMQSTALTDKNGKGIWEGDVLLVPDEYKDVVIPETGEGPMEPFNHLVPVVFSKGSFGVEIASSGYFIETGFMSFSKIEADMGNGFVATECEVIGSVYENPDLLPAA